MRARCGQGRVFMGEGAEGRGGEERDSGVAGVVRAAEVLEDGGGRGVVVVREVEMYSMRVGTLAGVMSSMNVNAGSRSAVVGAK